MSLRRLFDFLPFGSVAEITPHRLMRAIEEGSAELLDVRTRAEYAAGHLAGAKHTPITSFAKALDALPLHPTRTVVAIWASGHRSTPAVRALVRRGFVDAVQLAGGMGAWRSAGLPVVR